jgi:hypothetical protein
VHRVLEGVSVVLVAADMNRQQGERGQCLDVSIRAQSRHAKSEWKRCWIASLTTKQMASMKPPLASETTGHATDSACVTRAGPRLPEARSPWTFDGRLMNGGGRRGRWGRRGSPARVAPARTELISLIGSVPLRVEVARRMERCGCSRVRAMITPSQFIRPGLVR